MKFVKLLRYVEKSFEDKPSFLILMDDGKEYISSGYVFEEFTEENVIALQEEHNCEMWVNELLASPQIDLKDITNACYMFYGARLTSFDSDMGNVTNACYMFYGARLTSFDSDMGNVTNARWMFGFTGISSFSSDISSVTDATCMFYGHNMIYGGVDTHNFTIDSDMFAEATSS